MGMDIKMDENTFKRVSTFLNIGYKDYLASRILFNNGQLYRATIIANTAVEKYLKVFNLVNGQLLKTHNVVKLFEKAKEFDSGLEKAINNDFIRFIGLAYHTRYLDDNVFNNADKEFRLSIAQYKTLAELDNTVWVLQNSWNVTVGGSRLIGMYDEDLKNKNKHLYENNYILNQIPKSKFIEQEQEIYRIKNIKDKGSYEEYFKSLDAKDDGIFVYM